MERNLLTTTAVPIKAIIMAHCVLWLLGQPHGSSSRGPTKNRKVALKSNETNEKLGKEYQIEPPTYYCVCYTLGAHRAVPGLFFCGPPSLLCGHTDKYLLHDKEVCSHLHSRVSKRDTDESLLCLVMEIVRRRFFEFITTQSRYFEFNPWIYYL